VTLSLVAAVAANRVIGCQGRLPWSIPDDLARFRRLTLGHPVIMGRATWESLGRADSSDVPGRAPLGRADSADVPGRAPLGRADSTDVPGRAPLRGPLPGRANIVLTRSADWHAAGCVAVRSFDEAMSAAADAPGADEAFVIGGASVYSLFLPRASRLYITWIDTDVPGDAFFPEVDWDEWCVTREDRGPDAPLPHRFTDYQRLPRRAARAGGSSRPMLHLNRCQEK